MRFVVQVAADNKVILFENAAEAAVEQALRQLYPEDQPQPQLTPIERAERALQEAKELLAGAKSLMEERERGVITWSKA